MPTQSRSTPLPIVPVRPLPAGCSLSLGIRETLTLVVPWTGTTRPAMIVEVDPAVWDDEIVDRCVSWVQRREAAMGISQPPLKLLD